MLGTTLFLSCIVATTQTFSVPEVAANGSITFRLKAPNAQKVTVGLEGGPNIDLQKGADGIWTAQSGPLDPDIYGYGYTVDGVPTFDPANPRIKPNLIYVGNFVTVPGNPAKEWEVQNVPHGSVHHHFYKSGVIGDERDYYVYTPPGFSVNSRTKLPVLYLLHGFSDMANGWTSVGMAHTILDNLIAQKKAKPMIVVMTLGYGVPDYASPTRVGPRDNADTNRNFTLFREALLSEVKPMIEHDYHTLTDKSHRAIAGLSMGGAETVFTGLNNLDKFDYIGAFSAGVLRGNDLSVHFPDLAAKYEHEKPKLVWVACGTSDGLIGFNRGLCSWLKSQKVDVEQVETPGAHTWMVWRRNLITFSQRLFWK